MVEIISANQVGESYVGSNAGEFQTVANRLIEMLQRDPNMPNRCKNLAYTLFSTENAAKQIISALKHGR